MEFSDEILELAARLNVRLEDVEEQFVRGSGAGGQKINKTSSRVFLKYVPSGLIVRCQRHREREKNRMSAYKLLLRKIEEIRLGKKSLIAQNQFKLKKQKARRSRKSKEKMLKAKAMRGEVKKLRKSAI